MDSVLPHLSSWVRSFGPSGEHCAPYSPDIALRYPAFLPPPLRLPHFRRRLGGLSVWSLSSSVRYAGAIGSTRVSGLPFAAGFSFLAGIRHGLLGAAGLALAAFSGGRVFLADTGSQPLAAARARSSAVAAGWCASTSAAQDQRRTPRRS